VGALGLGGGSGGCGVRRCPAVQQLHSGRGRGAGFEGGGAGGSVWLWPRSSELRLVRSSGVKHLPKPLQICTPVQLMPNKAAAASGLGVLHEIHVLLAPTMDATNHKPETRPIYKTIELSSRKAKALNFNELQVMLKEVRTPVCPPLPAPECPCATVWGDFAVWRCGTMGLFLHILTLLAPSDAALRRGRQVEGGNPWRERLPQGSR
jgi:hypothetical protein